VESAGLITGSALVSALAFQGAWFACVLGAAKGLAWIGPAMVAALFAVEMGTSARPRAVGMPAVFAAAAGLLVDSLLAAGGWFRFASPWEPAWLSPPWMVALWPNFVLALRGCLRWLAGRYGLGGLLGAAGGPAAYAAGSRLGALEIVDPDTALVLVALLWGASVPGFLWFIRHPPAGQAKGRVEGGPD
jgi:hypothetical protein